MSDNLHTFNDEVLEQDEMLADLTTLTGTVNTNTGNITTINNLNIANKFAGSVSSGLKTLIAGNDTDIQNIETKTDYITVTGNINLDTVLSNTNTNNSKVTYPSADATKVGRITIDGNLNLSTMSSNITTNTNGIDAIEVKTDNISVTQAVNLDTMESNIATNNSKVGITTTQANNITTNNSKTGITGVQSNNILNNNDKIGISLSQISAISSNTSGLSALGGAFPRFVNIRQYASTTADIYNDGKVKLNWDGSNRQLRFFVLDIPTGDYTVGGVQKWAGTSSTRVTNYISVNNSSYYHYFTGPQISGAVLNSSFNLTGNYTRATYFLTAYLENDWPSYEITVLIGYSAGYHTISIKRFN